MKRPDGVTILGIYHLVMLALGVFAICGIVIGLFVVLVDQPPGAGTAVFWLVFSIVVVLILAAAHGVMGWGLLNMKEWARWGSIVIAVISLLGFPIFTAIGAVAIWYLLQQGVKDAFVAEVAEAPSEEEALLS